MKKIKDIIYYLLILICLFGIIYSSYNIIIWKKSIDTNKTLKNKIDNSISVIKEKIIEIDEELEEEYKKVYYKEYFIDFKSLKEKNPDTVAYLRVKNTNISHIVVRGNDNSFYLNHTFDRSYNVAGWIFADYKNKFDGTDRNIVVYGHNTRDYSMFGTLKNTLNKDWQDNLDNRYITFDTEEEKGLYQVFSTYIVEPEEYYINTEFNSDSEFLDFIKTIKNRSNYNYQVDVNEHDQILTLSSCTTGGVKRVVLHAKKVKMVGEENENN